MPVVEVVSEAFRLDRVANVVTNICSLGGQVDLISVVEKDRC